MQIFHFIFSFPQKITLGIFEENIKLQHFLATHIYLYSDQKILQVHTSIDPEEKNTTQKFFPIVHFFGVQSPLILSTRSKG